MTSCRQCREHGFTLVEMLTVVAIIALLISILVPSLSKARVQAKKVKTATMIAGISNNLEMFNNQAGDYPDSTARPDPVINWPAMVPANADLRMLSGAHWLLRALVGHDFQGVDRQQVVLRDGAIATVKYDDLVSASRFDVFLDDAKVYTRDSDAMFKTGTGDFVPTGRGVIFDDFNNPVLYYKANARASRPFTEGPGGVYNHLDNAEITGSPVAKTRGWDFAAAGQGGSSQVVHPLGQFISDPNNIEVPPSLHTSDSSQDPKAKAFTKYVHDHAAHEAGGIIKPVKPDTFLLISPGVDGLYGTDDDVNNFSRAM